MMTRYGSQEKSSSKNYSKKSYKKEIALYNLGIINPIFFILKLRAQAFSVCCSRSRLQKLQYSSFE